MIPEYLLIDIKYRRIPASNDFDYKGVVVQNFSASTAAWPDKRSPMSPPALYLHFQVDRAMLRIPTNLSAGTLLYLGERKHTSGLKHGFTGSSKYKWLRNQQNTRLLTVYFRLPVTGTVSYRDDKKRKTLEFLVFAQILGRHLLSKDKGLFRRVGGYQFRMNWTRANEVKADAKTISAILLKRHGI